ncbi:MAG: hypothetical protein HYS14_04130 [Candidatus Rokubacteria bacterium]|nr:hypothetical protein [Candidatus Rokubacteria bacterium]
MTRSVRLVIAFSVLALVGCGKSSPTGSTATTSVTAGQQSIVSRHNAQFFNDKTTRWEVPINIFIVNPGGRDILRDWEVQTGGAIRLNFIDYNPGEGIRFRALDLPGNIVGFSGLFEPPSSAGVIVAQTPRIHTLRIPQVISNRVRNCDVFLDPILWQSGAAVFWHVVKHEVGHCLGFVDHTFETDSVMSSLESVPCCPTKIIPRVADMLRELYTLPIGTEVH